MDVQRIERNPAQETRGRASASAALAQDNSRIVETSIPARLDNLRTSVFAAKSRIDEASARANAVSDVSSSVKKARANAGAAHAQVDTARAKRDRAALDLSYAKIFAPLGTFCTISSTIPNSRIFWCR